jgi:membrane protease YdiL (CAAX protease family)
MSEQSAPKPWIYAAAFVVTIVCLVVANYVLAYAGGQANVEPGRPAAVALAFVQGLAGALLAAFASRQLFKSLRPGDFSLKWIIILVAILFAIAIVWLLATGKAQRAMTWTTYAGVSALVGTEVGRRIAKALWGRPGPESGAAPLPD